MVTARERGRCVVCLQRYGVLDELGLVTEGWAHLDCSTIVRRLDAGRSPFGTDETGDTSC